MPQMLLIKSSYLRMVDDELLSFTNLPFIFKGSPCNTVLFDYRIILQDKEQAQYYYDVLKSVVPNIKIHLVKYGE